MSKTKIHLQTSAITDVPIQIYGKDFTFIINGEEFRTTKIKSDLISPKICQIHSIDPTFETYSINTNNRGNFSYILQLVNFSETIIPDEELQFLSEILDNLQNDNIILKLPPIQEGIAVINVISLIQKHEKNKRLYSEYLKAEIEFISKHFYELKEEQENELKNISVSTLEEIFSQKELQLRDENQLLKILNRLYQNDSKYSILYKYIYFSIVDEENICEFIDAFDIADLDNEIWMQISDRLKQKVEISDYFGKTANYRANRQYAYSKMKKFVCQHDNKFDGIINYLIKASNNNIQSEVNITSSSVISRSFMPYNACLYEDKDKDKYFETNAMQNSWICFDFKERKIIPTNYVIMSGQPKTVNNPKNWIIEVSNDYTNWKTIDEHHECLYFNDKHVIHTFDIQQQLKDPYRYIRLKQTGPNWLNQHYLVIGSIEFYGNLIE